MATLGATVLTLADWAKRLDPDGGVPTIVELLSQTNEIIKDMLFKQGNLPTGERTTVRTGLPTVAWRLLNQGTAPSKSTTAQIDEGTGMLEAWSEVDVELANLNGNQAEFRLSEGMAFIEAMNQEFAQTFFYGNSGTAPEEFLGLAARYSDPTATNGSNVIDAGGSGSDNTSIWLVGWGANSIFGIFPKGSIAGLRHDNYGEETVEVTAGVAGNRMRAHRDRCQWKVGPALKDWRYVVRIGSIDVSNLVGVSSAADIIEMMIKAIHRIPFIASVKPVFYMNRTTIEMLEILQRNDVISGGGLRLANVNGVPSPSFRGIPIRLCDAILETESLV